MYVCIYCYFLPCVCEIPVWSPWWIDNLSKKKQKTKTCHHASSWLFQGSRRYLKAARGGDAADVRGRCSMFVSQSEIKFPKTEKQVDMETVSCVTCFKILFYTFLIIIFMIKSSEASVTAGWTRTLNWSWTSLRFILSLHMTQINNW